MKRILIVTASVMIVAILAIGVSTANAGKSPKVIYYSNGFPSGDHFNLNIHGKKIDYVCDPTAGGNSIFIPLYSGGDEQNGYDASIEYLTNRKSSVSELTVLDNCSGFENVVNDPSQDEPDPAKVQIPYEAQGYYVFGRILGKPKNGKPCIGDSCPSKIILYPNIVRQACNDSEVIGDPPFGEYTDCEGELALGVIVGENLYLPDPAEEAFERFDPGATKGKGKSKATDITRLFTYEGWVVDEILDTEAPFGIIDINDVPSGDYDGDVNTSDNQDYNNDGSIDEDDVEAWLTDLSAQDPPMAWYFSHEDEKWILNIADLVVTEQGLVNDGTKLLQLRFYPFDTTSFEPYVP
jgi:hypothetical protein